MYLDVTIFYHIKILQCTFYKIVNFPANGNIIICAIHRIVVRIVPYTSIITYICTSLRVSTTCCRGSMNPRTPRQASLSTMCSPLEITLRVFLSGLFLFNGELNVVIARNALFTIRTITLNIIMPLCFSDKIYF